MYLLNWSNLSWRLEPVGPFCPRFARIALLAHTVKDFVAPCAATWTSAVDTMALFAPVPPHIGAASTAGAAGALWDNTNTSRARPSAWRSPVPTTGKEQGMGIGWQGGGVNFSGCLVLRCCTPRSGQDGLGMLSPQCGPRCWVHAGLVRAHSSRLEFGLQSSPGIFRVGSDDLKF